MVAASPAMRHSPSIARRAPIDCAASSMTGRPGTAACDLLDRRHLAEQVDGDDGLGALRPRAAATAVGAMLNVSGSMSTNTGVAPTLWIVPAVAKKVNGVVMTSSPRPTSSARSASRIASVPFAQPTAYFVCDSPATLALELRDRLPEDERLIVDDLHHRGDDVVTDGGVLGAKVEQRNGHDGAGASGAARRQARPATVARRQGRRAGPVQPAKLARPVR